MNDFQKDPSSLSPMKKLFIACLFMLPVIAVVVYGMTGSKNAAKSSLAVVDWDMYKQLDLANPKVPQSLLDLDGNKIRSPGFMVPLEDNRAEVTEFLLVPNPQACIHAPPPPSNQMVYVRMVGKPAKTLFGPVMVEGTLRVSNQSHQYGVASFQIYGDYVDLYKRD